MFRTGFVPGFVRDDGTENGNYYLWFWAWNRVSTGMMSVWGLGFCYSAARQFWLRRPLTPDSEGTSKDTPLASIAMQAGYKTAGPHHNLNP